MRQHSGVYPPKASGVQYGGGHIRGSNAHWHLRSGATHHSTKMGAKGKKLMSRLATFSIGSVLIISAGVASAEQVDLRCHMPFQARSDNDIAIQLDTTTQTVTNYGLWDSVETLYWSEEVIYWYAKGSWDDHSNFSLGAYHPQTSQLITYAINHTQFDQTNQMNILLQSLPAGPPYTCYRTEF